MEATAPSVNEHTDNGHDEQGGTPAPAKRELKRSTRIGLAVIGVLALVAVVGFAGTYFLYSRNYVSTDNAQVDGDKIVINAPTSGYVTNWAGGKGTVLRREQVLGRIKMDSGFVSSLKAIKSPGAGTIAVDNAVEGAWVPAGTQLAVAYNLDRVYVTARVEETDLSGVRVGAPVDIDVDAYSDTEVTGRVVEIQNSVAGVFALFPQQNSSGNFQKVTQVVPIRIALTSTGGRRLAPGMNVTVRIHKNS